MFASSKALLGWLYRIGRPRRLGDSGAAAVEFAVLAPVLFMLMFGIVEGARAVWSWNTLQLAVEEASRRAAVRPDTSATTIREAATGMAVGLDPSLLTMNIVIQSPATGPRVADVSATYALPLLVPGLLGLSDTITLRARSRMAIID